MRHVDAPIVNGVLQPSAAAQQLMLESHTVASRAWLMGGNGERVLRLPLVSGSASCDSGSVVRRSGSVVVLGRWSDPALQPYGARIQVQRGIRVEPDLTEWMTLITGPIWESAQDGDDAGPDAITLPVKDEMASIGADRFDANTSTNTAETVSAAILRLIRRTLPAATLYDLSGALGGTLCGKLDLQKDPAGGLMKLAAAIGCELFTGRGWMEFVLRPVPRLDDPPSWQVIAGPRGNLLTAPRKRTRERVYNRVVATGETNESTGTTVPPASGDARITDSADPLYYGGPFGRVTRFYSSSLLKTTEQCTTAAAAILEKVRGRDVEVSFTTLVNPAIDGGDRFDSMLTDGTRMKHLVDSVSVPLSAADTQSLSARSVEIPDENASSDMASSSGAA